MRLFRHEVRTQQLLFWRNRESAVFVFIFPPMLFLLLGAVYGGRIDGFKAADVLLIGMIGYGCANTAFAGSRDHARDPPRGRDPQAHSCHPAPSVDVPRRRSHLDVRSSSCLQMLVMIGLGVALYGARGPQNVLGLILAVLLGVVAFAGLGFGAAVTDPVVGGRVGRRQLGRPADGVSLWRRSARLGAIPRCCSGSRTCCR